jgi:hypothetical protein
VGDRQAPAALTGAGASILKSAGWYGEPNVVFGGIEEFKSGKVFGVGIVLDGAPRGVDIMLSLS